MNSFAYQHFCFCVWQRFVCIFILTKKINMNTEMLRNKVYESLEWLVEEDSLDPEQVRSEINECSVISDFREIYRKYGYTPNEGTEMILKILSC